MPYYHAYIVYRTKNGKKRENFLYNFSEIEVIRSFATPYMNNRAILVGGNFVHPSDIDIIIIFVSEQSFHELILPNGKSPIDEKNLTYIYDCFCRQKVKGVVGICTHEFITSQPEEKKELGTPELTIGLMESASFLGLDTNWSLATCALQLQEVAVTLVAERKNIKLDKANVEKVLNKKIESLSFNDQYEAFSRQVKSSFNIEMPILTTHLRKMRTKVLHEGYNPKPEETESIASFTTGLLKKLKDIS